MLARLIQSIFFLSICSSVHAMNTKQKDIVHAKLYDNLYRKHEIAEAPKHYRTIVQPLPDLKFNRSKIRANHIKDLHSLNEHQQVLDSYEVTKNYTPDDLSILKPESQKAYRSMEKSYHSSKSILEQSDRINAKMTEKNIRLNALMGDKNAQVLIAEQYINKLSNITDAPEILEAIKSQHCLQAYELLDFTTTLNDRNLPCPLTDSHDRQLVALRNKISTTNPSAAYIIQSIRYLQPFTEYKKKLCYSNLSTMIPDTAETEIICQFLINYGDSTLSPQNVAKKFIESINNCGNDTNQIIQTISNCKNSTLSSQDIAEQLKRIVTSQKTGSDLLSAIAKNPLCSKVIQKLSSVTFDRNDLIIPEIHYILAELYYANKDYVRADSFYKKSTFKLIKEKNARLNAFQACIRGSEISDPQDITYLFYLADNVYNQLQEAIEKDRISLSTIITQLSRITLESNHPFIQDFNYVLAELYYKDKDYIQADSFYKKNKVATLKEKKVQYHAFTANIATSQSFSKQDINYLSSLVGNIYSQLKKMDTTNPSLSYKVGLLIYALVNNNPGMNITEKIEMLHDALHHLEHTQKDVATCLQIHTQLSILYASQNNYIACLKHTKTVLQEHAIATILDNAEKNSPEFYKQHAQLIQHIIDCIINENHATGITKNYTPPAEFISSDLCKQLLPYCEQLCQNNKNSGNEIIRLIVLSHIENSNYNKAYEYIHTLPQPLSQSDLLLKARIYLAIDKILSDSELEPIFKAFVNNKKSSATDQEIISSLIDQYTVFFSTPSAEKQDLAIKLITKLSDKQPTPAAAINLAFNITNSFGGSNKTPQWQEKLNSCITFYTNIAESSHYNGYINFIAGLLFMQSKIVSDPKHHISYFTAALESKELSPQTTQYAQKAIATLYNEWAIAITNDPDTRLVLLNKALEYNNNSTIRFNNAMNIFEHSKDQIFINQALQLLEENITQDCPEKTLSQVALAQAYCNYSTDPAHILVLKNLIPLDINKAIGYLQDHNNQPALLKSLINILIGQSTWIEKQLAEQYINLEKALYYTNILIDNNPTSIDSILGRLNLHIKLGNTDAAIEDVDLMLNAQDLSNSRGITKESLLLQKVELLLTKNSGDTIYDQIIECFKQLKACNEKNIIHFNAFPLIQERTKYLVANNITTDEAITWCCFAANSCVAADNGSPASRPPLQEEKDLAHYIFSAAKAGNLEAQLIAFPYLNTIAYVAPFNLTEALRYSHQALLTPDSVKHQTNVIYLTGLLKHFATNEGVALAYYILLDYYKEKPEEVKKIMLLFHAAKQHDHPKDDAADLIEAIYDSCKNTLSEHAKGYVANAKQKNILIKAIATVTLGFMCQYSNTKNRLTSGLLYLTTAIKNDFYNTFKCPQYELPITRFLGCLYYKLALIDEKSGIIDYKELCTSAKIGCLPAVYKLANIYINQHKNGKQDIPVKTTDFMPLLARDLADPHSRILFEECQKILETATQNEPIVYKTNSTNLNTILPNQTKPAKSRNQIVQEAKSTANFIITSPRVTSLIKYTNDQESNKQYSKASQLIENGNNKKAIPLLQQAVKKNNPTACMILALIYITDRTNTDYNQAETILKQALSCGLVKNNKTKMFYNRSFLNTFIQFIENLITEEHPEKIASHLLSTIHNTLVSNGIDMKAFCALFKEISSIDLLSIPEWTTNKNSQPLRIASDARIALVKDVNDKELPAEFSLAIEKHSQGNTIYATQLLQHVATQQKMPSAYMMLACNHIIGNSVGQNYAISEEYLHNAFGYGLIEKQFCNNNFLCTVYSCIKGLVSAPISSPVKERSLQIIKHTLIDHGINMSAFYTVVKESTNTDLLSVPEWVGTNTNNKSSIIDLKKKLIKDPTNSNISQDYKNALAAVLQKDVTKSVILMEVAAGNNDSCACITIADNYLLGREGTRKCLFLALCSLKAALEHGFIEQQFCNSLFLNKLCKFIRNVIFASYTPDEIKVKKQFLLHIKTELPKHTIDLTEFCDIVSNETQINLLTCPEWLEAEKNAKFTDEELASFLDESLQNKDFTINEFQTAMIHEHKQLITKSVNPEDSLIQNPNYEDIPAFLTAVKAMGGGDVKSSIALIKDIAEKKDHPQAYLILASEYARGRILVKNQQISETCLKKALIYGLVPKQFCNRPFFKALCAHMYVMITDKSFKNIKQKSLSTIKKTLKANNIEFEIFEAVFEKEYDIKLSTIREWK